MPYRKTYASRSRRRAPYRKRRNTYGLATIPKMMTYNRFKRRWNQVDSRVFWMKLNGTINLNDQAYQYYAFPVQRLTGEVPPAGGPPPPAITNPPNGWLQLCEMYDQYKVLGVKYSLFPCNVGIEATGGSGTTNQSIYLNRGNHCIWIDQRADSSVQPPTSISEIISTSSARLINARQPYKTSIWRPKGRPTWGSCKDYNQIGDAKRLDPWNGIINHFIEGGTRPNQVLTGTLPIFYYTLEYKVIFRGRVDV